MVLCVYVEDTSESLVFLLCFHVSVFVLCYPGLLPRHLVVVRSLAGEVVA